MVVEHLLSMGHERIGLINWRPGVLIGDVRSSGYYSAMENAGINVDPDWVASTPNILLSASEATARLMSAKYPPTAIVCTNDVMAFGAKAYLDEMGYRDVALTGYDDDPTAQFLGITSVRQPIDTVAKTLFDILLGEIDHEPRPQRQVAFDPELIIRASTSF
jgi:LacI family transcriptional regulator